MENKNYQGTLTPEPKFLKSRKKKMEPGGSQTPVFATLEILKIRVTSVRQRLLQTLGILKLRITRVKNQKPQRIARLILWATQLAINSANKAC